MIKNKKIFFSILFLSLFLLSGCRSFNGFRTPLYDGEKIIPATEAIKKYRTNREIVGEEKEAYFRYDFSEEIYNKSLDFLDQEPVLLEEGTYTVGEDLAEGRVTFQGNYSIFTSDNYEVHVGNLVIRDTEGEIYFENLFHSEYGQLVAQVDLRSGHEVTITGVDSEITAFYSSELPEDPYEYMSSIEVLENLDRLERNQPIQTDGDEVSLTAGIYEVGTHLDAGVYELVGVSAVHNTEMYLFRENEEPRVFELLVNNQEEDNEKQKDRIEIHLEKEDKIYPNLTHRLILKKIDEN